MMATDLLSSELWHEVVARADSDAPALFAGGEAISYGRLQALVGERLDHLALTERSLVLLHGRPSREWVVTYLALLAGGHVPLLAGANHEPLMARWSPDAVVAAADSGVAVTRSQVRRIHCLHPDLALLLSTSGSTASPKLVRLSHRNLAANARAIVEILGLTSADRGITSLPLHYCYGLSVLHSHLLAGGAVALADASVVDPCFRAAMAEHGVTTLAGVPHTYALLERAGPELIRVPSLRLLTQAGGRMAPPDVLRWGRRARQWGAELVVMYGQTEATARIAYLPSELLQKHPDAVGIAVPGSSIRLQPIDGGVDGIGEVVVRGEHVMMGYAAEPDDVARGSELTELFTGDLARRDAHDDVITIVGRRSRFVKPLGLRIDLDHLQTALRDALGAAASGDAVEVAVTGDDEGVAVAVVGAPPSIAREQTCALTGLPLARVAAVELDTLPRTESGKLDLEAVARAVPAPADDTAPATTDTARQVAAVYGTVLGVPAVRMTDSFVSLGGDSLSYIECSIRLERVLGRLPDDWHLQPVGALEAARPRRLLARLDTTVVLRALSICLVVGTHMGVFHFPGGAHALLAIVGYNLARFMGSIDDLGARLRAGLCTVARVALPTVVWVAVGIVAFGAYSGGTMLLVNNYVGTETHNDDHWHFWFIEVFTHLVLLVSLLLAVPALRRIERRRPYWCALGAFAVAFVLAMDWAVIGDAYNQRFRTHSVAIYFFAGWLIAQSTRMWQRIATSALLVLALPWFFDHSDRDWFILGSALAVLWIATVPLPRALVRPLSTLAAASMWILITHFTLWPIYVEHLPLVQAYAATLASGVFVALTVTWATRAIRGVQPFQRNARPAGGQPCSPAALVA